MVGVGHACEALSRSHNDLISLDIIKLWLPDVRRLHNATYNSQYIRIMVE